MSHAPLPEDLLSRLDDDGWLDAVRQAAAAPALDRVGEYELLEEAGRGGQGVVYRAFHPRTRTFVALKRLFGAPDSATTIERIRREVEVVSALDHPAIVRVERVSRDDGRWLLTMPWVDGRAVDRWAAEENMATAERVRLVMGFADALAHAHQRGVIHRDVKPSNLLVDTEGAPRVLDFGLAKVLNESAETRTHGFLGTPAFASPEQLQSAPLDVRSDVYSLGVVLRDLVRGAPADSLPDLPAILEMATAERPDDRYQSMSALRDDLERVLAGEPALARWGTREQSLRAAWRRLRWPLAAGGAALAVLGVVAVVLTFLWRDSAEHAARAERTTAFLESVLYPAGSGATVADASLIDVLEDAVQRVDTEFPDDPQTRARLHSSLLSAYMRLWRWPDVAAQGERALPIIREFYGPRSEEYALALANTGMAGVFGGDPAARGRLEESLSITRDTLPADHPRVISARTALAFSLWRDDVNPDPARAERIYADVLPRYEAEGTPTIRWASALYSYGAMLIFQERHDEAVERLEQALGVYDELPPTFDLHRARCAEDLGQALLLAGRAARAAEVLAQALAERPASDLNSGTVYAWLALARARRTARLAGVNGAVVEALAANAHVSGRADSIAAKRLAPHVEAVRRDGRVTPARLSALADFEVAWAVPLDSFREWAQPADSR